MINLSLPKGNLETAFLSAMNEYKIEQLQTFLASNKLSKKTVSLALTSVTLALIVSSECLCIDGIDVSLGGSPVVFGLACVSLI